MAGSAPTSTLATATSGIGYISKIIPCQYTARVQYLFPFFYWRRNRDIENVKNAAPKLVTVFPRHQFIGHFCIRLLHL
jgi:hypothetical protein